MLFRPLMTAAALVLTVLSGCAAVDRDIPATTTVFAPAPEPQSLVVNNVESRDTALEEPDPPRNLWAYLARQSTWEGLESPEVLAAREYWLSQQNLFAVLHERATPALQYVIQELERREMPIELALIPIIESSLNPWAYSSQHAAGFWQITPATADHFGLQRSWWYDARYDIPSATGVALDYLAQLNERYGGDWFLTLAAYNAGPGRVDRALRRATTDDSKPDYWTLRLPRETRRYVPKLLGLISVLRDADYDASNWPDTPISASWVAVDTGGQIELARAAELAGLDEATLRRLNPGHLRWASAPEAHTLWVPREAAARLTEGLVRLPASERVRWHRYEIQPGDSLIRIARRFDSEVTLIREVNALSGNLIRAGDELLIPEGDHWPDSLRLAQRARKTPARPSRYRVKRGDSLWEIAQQYRVSVDSLLRWNRLSADAYLQPGQTLRLQP